MPELVALFLPRDLLAATFVTAAVAIPVLLASAAVEIWVSPHILEAIAAS